MERKRLKNYKCSICKINPACMRILERREKDKFLKPYYFCEKCSGEKCEEPSLGKMQRKG